MAGNFLDIRRILIPVMSHALLSGVGHIMAAYNYRVIVLQRRRQMGSSRWRAGSCVLTTDLPPYTKQCSAAEDGASPLNARRTPPSSSTGRGRVNPSDILNVAIMPQVEERPLMDLPLHRYVKSPPGSQSAKVSQ